MPRGHLLSRAPKTRQIGGRGRLSSVPETLLRSIVAGFQAERPGSEAEDCRVIRRGMGFVVTIRAMGSSPLREALSRLVGEGLVTFEGNKGFRVGGLSREDLADIAYMRTAVETFAVRTAIERGGMEWESGLVGALHALVTTTRDTDTDRASLDAWNIAHDRFHEALISACGSPRVMETQRRLAEHHNRYRRTFMGDNLPRQVLI